nr:hypothetical protein [Lachnospiraceae bacterium]
RVIRNLVENAAIENVPAMVSCMRKIEEIAEKMRSDDNENDIYSVLNNYSDVVPDSRLESQLKEEIEKAKQIKTHENYEAKIKEAEQFSFFNGTIRFLYLNEESSVDWDKFDDKFKRAKELFNVKNNYNKVETKTITEFLKLFKGFNEVEGMFLFTSVGYHPRHRCWKRDILCCDDIAEKVHQLLSGDTEEAKRECNYQEFLDSGLIDRIVEKYENYRFRYHWHNGWAIHKERSQTEGVYVSKERKVKCEVLNRLAGEKQITVLNDNFNFYCKGYYWGLCVAFEHEGKKYYWRSEYDSNSKKSVDKLYKTDADSKDYVIWENPKDLIVVLTSKPLETS